MQLLTRMDAKPQHHSLTLGWNDEEGIFLVFELAVTDHDIADGS
ncbi:hypothetical protein ACU6ZM_23585 [Klebsiella aerogenes]